MIKEGFGSRMFDLVNGAILVVFALLTVVPFLHIIAGSFASEEEAMSSSFLLIPMHYSIRAYQYIFSTDELPRGLLVSIFITTAGTLINLFFTSLTAYSLSRRRLHFRRMLMFLVLFTIIFQGGIIPSYLVVKELGLLNSYWSLLIPGAIAPFYLIILVNFFRQLPEELEESAKMDGCGEWRMFLRITLPLSLPALATLTLFYAVGHWNTYLPAILYMNDSTKWPVQVLLRQIVLISQSGLADQGSVADSRSIPPDTVRMAVITIATFPILVVYPFLQKHFAQGILLGSVKG